MEAWDVRLARAAAVEILETIRKKQSTEPNGGRPGEFLEMFFA
jgi:hypothetical protein